MKENKINSDTEQSFQFVDPQKNKCKDLFFNAIISNIQNYDQSKVQALAYELTQNLFEIYSSDIPKMVRSKCFNLKDKTNPALCRDVYSGSISPEKYIRMSQDEMKSLELRKEEENIIQNSIFDCQVPEMKAETDIFKCSKCGERKTSYRQLQTRSSDEPMTTFVTCVCGHKWRFC